MQIGAGVERCDSLGHKNARQNGKELDDEPRHGCRYPFDEDKTVCAAENAADEVAHELGQQNGDVDRSDQITLVVEIHRSFLKPHDESAEERSPAQGGAGYSLRICPHVIEKAGKQGEHQPERVPYGEDVAGMLAPQV